MSKSIENIVKQTVDNFIEEENIESIDVNENTKLFGSDALFSSIQLVSFITELEENLEDEMNIEITLADEKAMSMRTSPFSRVKYLIAFVEGKLNDNE